ncbi:hypothetical protein D3C85_646090 [compost metagenome]
MQGLLREDVVVDGHGRDHRRFVDHQHVAVLEHAVTDPHGVLVLVVGQQRQAERFVQGHERDLVHLDAGLPRCPLQLLDGLVGGGGQQHSLPCLCQPADQLHQAEGLAGAAFADDGAAYLPAFGEGGEHAVYGQGLATVQVHT